MDRKKENALKSRGWTVGSAGDFLDLTPEEARYIELKLALSRGLKDERQQQGMTQVDLARLMQSSQSRIAKMEGGDPTVSVDLLLKALLTLGLTRKQLAGMIA